jgi:hypothetical protein
MAKPESVRYNRAHKALRARLAREVAAGRAVCWRCGKPILPRSEWHVGHDDFGQHVGSEHAFCNLSAAGKRAAMLARMQRRALSPSRPIPPKPKPPVSPELWGPRDPDPDNSIERWSRHWSGSEYNPRCPACVARDSACDEALGRR